jgi:hypothetical protein
MPSITTLKISRQSQGISLGTQSLTSNISACPCNPASSGPPVKLVSCDWQAPRLAQTSDQNQHHRDWHKVPQQTMQATKLPGF